jgi:hypothetical protein
MKTNLPTISKLLLLSFISVVYLTSCSSSQKVAFNTSTVDPGAEGHVKVKKDNNGNYTIDVNIDGLADSKKLTPAKNIYIVWIETDEGTKNIGQIHSGGSRFSKAKKASITTVSTHKPKRIFISAEDDPKIETPGTQIVMTTDSF